MIPAGFVSPHFFFFFFPLHFDGHNRIIHLNGMDLGESVAFSFCLQVQVSGLI